jgi:hypothetical protein
MKRRIHHGITEGKTPSAFFDPQRSKGKCHHEQSEGSAFVAGSKADPSSA